MASPNRTTLLRSLRIPDDHLVADCIVSLPVPGAGLMRDPRLEEYEDSSHSSKGSQNRHHRHHGHHQQHHEQHKKPQHNQKTQEHARGSASPKNQKIKKGQTAEHARAMAKK